MSPAGQSPTMGSTSLPPMPGAPPPQGAGVGSLLGGPPVNLPQTGPTPQQRVQAYMDQIRSLHMGIDALAQDHPEASEDLLDAKNALTNSMSKVATAMTAPEGGPTPLTF